MERAHLIVNPNARLVTAASTRGVASVLADAFPLKLSETSFPSDGTEAARRAAEGGAGLVIAFGGDGLVNEVVNGLVGTDVSLGIVPGGTMNVFARSLGIPRAPLEAARTLVDRLRGDMVQFVDLGRANERYFTFSCGVGFDAETADRVNGHRGTKHRFGEPYFYAAALATLLGSYSVRAPFLRCEGDFRTRQGVMAIALVGRPYAYLGGRPIRLGASIVRPSGLSLFVLRDMRLWRVPGYAAGALLTGRFGQGAELIEGLGSVHVDADEPVPAHVDGERLTRSRGIGIGFVERILPVVA